MHSQTETHAAINKTEQTEMEGEGRGEAKRRRRMDISHFSLMTASIFIGAILMQTKLQRARRNIIYGQITKNVQKQPKKQKIKILVNFLRVVVMMMMV